MTLIVLQTVYSSSRNAVSFSIRTRVSARTLRDQTHRERMCRPFSSTNAVFDQRGRWNAFRSHARRQSAEDVAEVNPDLVIYDTVGKPFAVRYDSVNAMLLNEFLKEHRKNEEQEVTITQRQKQVEAPMSGLQKVSAQVQLNKTVPQTVLNNR
jgi:hypothetical protein